MGLLYAVMGPTLFAIMALENKGNAPMRPEDKMMMTILSGYYIGYGLLVLIVGVMHIFAGYQCLRFRSRVFALITLFGNILVVLTCYCVPTAIGMMIFTA